MKQLVPDYYRDFRCLMGDCAHTCCQGWEIDIDEDTMKIYRAQTGEFGEKLKKNIDAENGVFRLTEGERCPFLNEEGLCEIITNLGEGALCQICDDHPRFRVFFPDHTEIGLGLCCESAAKLILTRTEQTRLVSLCDDGEEAFALSEEDRRVLAFRDKCLKIAQMRNIPFDEKLKRLYAITDEPEIRADAEEFVRFLMTLEVMSADWTKRLKALLKAPAKKRTLLPEWEIPFEQLMCYLIFRHVSAAVEDGETSLRLRMVLGFTELICALLFTAAKPSVKELCEIARLFSAEIEYSDENIDWILDYLRAVSEGEE